MDILDAIGNTPMVRLRKVAAPGGADVFVKIEGTNPTGSMKDRMARAVILRSRTIGVFPIASRMSMASRPPLARDFGCRGQ